MSVGVAGGLAVLGGAEGVGLGAMDGVYGVRCRKWVSMAMFASAMGGAARRNVPAGPPWTVEIDVTATVRGGFRNRYAVVDIRGKA